MSVTYTLTQDSAHAVRSSDGAVIPWNADGDHPLDVGGLVDRQWQADGSPKSEPYVAPPPVFSVDAVFSECARRIYAVVSDNAQKNMAANAAAGNLSEADMASFKNGLAWIGAMQASCRSMIAAGDATYAEDQHWPVVPADAAALAERF